jgi:hypothetical protein
VGVQLWGYGMGSGSVEFDTRKLHCSCVDAQCSNCRLFHKTLLDYVQY